MSTITIPVVDDYGTLDAETLGYLAANAKDIAKYLEGARAYATKQLEDGKEVPGCKLKPGPKRREWVDEKTAIDAIRNAGLNDPYEHVLLSVPKVEKKIGEGAMDALRGAYYEKPGRPQLIAATVATPPPIAKHAADDFGF